MAIKNAALTLGFYLIAVTGHAQTASLQNFGTPFARSDLQIEWNLLTNSLPTNVWIYKLEPNSFKREAVVELRDLMRFTEKDKTYDGTNGIVYVSARETRQLGFHFPIGWVEYRSKKAHYDSKHLAQGVPDEYHARDQTIKILGVLGIHKSDIERGDSKEGAQFYYPSEEATYFVNHQFITNIEERTVEFRRSLDGLTVMGRGSGFGEITFGEKGEITAMNIKWPNFNRYKSCDIPNHETLMKWIRSGKAVQGWLMRNRLPIDWKTVKKVSVKDANIFYHSGSAVEFPPPNRLVPFIELSAIVEKGNGEKINVQIGCPVTDNATREKN